jgi:hypothetical protein
MAMSSREVVAVQDVPLRLAGQTLSVNVTGTTAAIGV